MVTLTSKTVCQNSFKNVLVCLRDNLTDPESRSNKKWVASSFPDNRGSTWVDYPLVVVGQPSINVERESFGAKNNQTVMISFAITIYSNKMEYADSIADDIKDQLETELEDLTLESMPPSESDTITIDGKKVYVKTLNVNFIWNGDIT
ncbi:MAG: hypothetical protein ABEK36_04375 [Candidatus Aenigmatarchaeota archaeon]